MWSLDDASIIFHEYDPIIYCLWDQRVLQNMNVWGKHSFENRHSKDDFILYYPLLWNLLHFSGTFQAVYNEVFNFHCYMKDFYTLKILKVCLSLPKLNSHYSPAQYIFTKLPFNRKLSIAVEIVLELISWVEKTLWSTSLLSILILMN